MVLRYLIGTCALVVGIGPVVWGSLQLRRRVLPTWSGAPGWLVQVVVVLAACLVTVTTLGVLGWYHPVPTTLLLAAVGAFFGWIARRVEPRVVEAPPRPPERLGNVANLAAVVSVSLFAATWGARTYVALSHGMVSIDSLWYHLPQAARYANGMSLTAIHHDVPDLSGYYPINSELLHSLGMVLLGTDFLSMVLNLGWGALAVLAAWCIGRPHGVAAVCVTGVVVLLCAPAFVGTQPGAAHSDIVGVALALTATAILMNADRFRLTRDPFALGLAAIAVGVAMGTKWTMLAFGGALTVAVIALLPRSRRLSLGALWVAIVTGFGAFSYVRNWVRVGSPLPNVQLTVAGIGIERKAPEMIGMDSLVGFLFDGAAWSDHFLPGLSKWFGYAWWAVLALTLAGLVCAIVTGPGRLVRAVGAVGAAAFVAYLVQPQFLTLLGRPFYFDANLRYASIAVALGLVVLPVTRAFSTKLAWTLPVAFVAIAVVMQFDSAVWPIDLRDLRWEEPVRGADAVAGLVIGVVTLAVGLVCIQMARRRHRDPARRVSPEDGTRRTPGTPSEGRVVVVVGSLVGAALVLVASQAWYLDHRYTRPDAATPFLERHWQAWEWATSTHDQHIAFNDPALSYPLYGNALTNKVEPLPHSGAVVLGDAAAKHVRCVDFHAAVNRRGYSYVVLFGSPAPPREVPPGTPAFEESIPEVTWLDSDPSATRVMAEDRAAVYRIDGPLDGRRCDAS